MSATKLKNFSVFVLELLLVVFNLSLKMFNNRTYLYPYSTYYRLSALTASDTNCVFGLVDDN